jgi:hypothetical protein
MTMASSRFFALLALAAAAASLLPQLALARPAQPGAGLPVIPVQAAPAAPAREWQRSVGEWTVTRYRDARTRRVASCDVERSLPDGSLLRLVAVPDRGLTFVFSSADGALEALGARFPVRYWFDDQTDPVTETAAQQSGFARFSEPDNEPGSSDALANGRVLFIEAGRTRLRFPLDRSNAAFRLQTDCLHQR